MSHHIRIFINQTPFTFEHREATVRVLKERACIPLDHALCMQNPHHHPHQECGRKDKSSGNELILLDNEQTVALEEGLRLWSIAPAAHGGVTVRINHKEYEFADAHQTGHSLKHRAGIAPTDVLFLDRPREDEVIADDKVRAAIAQGLARLKVAGGGSSTHATRALLLAEPPSVDGGEITDKGYINQRAVLARRADAVAILGDDGSRRWIGLAD